MYVVKSEFQLRSIRLLKSLISLLLCGMSLHWDESKATDVLGWPSNFWGSVLLAAILIYPPPTAKKRKSPSLLLRWLVADYLALDTACLCVTVPGRN